MNKKDFKKVLWDINEKDIDGLPTNFIVQRVLSYGGLFLIIKIIRVYGIDTVKYIFATMKPSGIPEKKYFYLKNFLLA